MAAPPSLHIGLSGWTYDSWKNDFYQGVPRKAWLAFYASRFAAVEVNASFYHPLSTKALQHWREGTPDGFRFAMKASRILTHSRRLRVTPEQLANERAHIDPLGDRLLAVLWQLPPQLDCDLPLLRDFLSQLDRWDTTRHAIEFRHPSWFEETVAAELSDHRVAAVQSHAGGWPMWRAVTTDLVYLRLHGKPVTYHSRYDDASLEEWARRIERWREEGRSVQAYFDNTDSGHAPKDALRLMKRLGVTSAGGVPDVSR